LFLQTHTMEARRRRQIAKVAMARKPARISQAD